MSERVWLMDNDTSVRWPIYTRGNVGEVFPEVVRPLTWDLYGVEAEGGWREAYADLGMSVPSDFGSEPWVVLGVFGGYCYINASYVRILGVRAPGASVEAIDQQFFGTSDAPPYEPKPGDKNLRASLKLGGTALNVLRTKELPGLAEDEARVAHFEATFPSMDADDATLLQAMWDFKPLFRHLFRTHIRGTFRLSIASGLLGDLCAKVNETDSMVAMLGGLGKVPSADPAGALWNLARNTPEGEIETGVAGFLKDHGSRGPNEWDIAADTWDLRPERVHAAIGRMRNASADHDPEQQQRELSARREETVARVRTKLKVLDRMQFGMALSSTQVHSQARERSKTTIIRAYHRARLAQRELARRAHERGGVEQGSDACFLVFDEFKQYVADPEPWLDTIAERKALCDKLNSLIPPFVFEGSQPGPESWTPRATPVEQVGAGTKLNGIPGCGGKAQGRARIVLDPGDPGALGEGDVLVAPITDPAWTPLFLAADAVVVDVGATMSHAVIVSRELGIPCVVSVTGATERIPDGALIEVDGDAGTVTVLQA